MKIDNCVPFFSILIPSYNSKKFIFNAIDSVLIQDFKDYEIIVCDQSTDDTYDLLNSKYSKRKEIKIIQQAIPNLLLARRNLQKNAKGKYLVNLDSDDCLFDGGLSKLYDFLIKNDYDMVQILWKTYPENKTTLRLKETYNLKNLTYDLFCSDSNNAIWSKVVKNSIIKKSIDNFDLPPISMGEDKINNISQLPFIKTFCYYALPFYRYRSNEVSMSNSIIPFRIFDDMNKSFGFTYLVLNKFFSDDEKLIKNYFIFYYKNLLNNMKYYIKYTNKKFSKTKVVINEIFKSKVYCEFMDYYNNNKYFFSVSQRFKFFLFSSKLFLFL